MLRAWTSAARNVYDFACGGWSRGSGTSRHYRYQEGRRRSGAQPDQAPVERDLSVVAEMERVTSAGHRNSRQAFGRGGELLGVARGDREGSRRSSWASFGVVRRAVAWALRGYKRWISPLLPPACRFSPTCSEYARLATLKYGVLGGGWRSAWRLVKCQPFHRGGVDLP